MASIPAWEASPDSLEPRASLALKVLAVIHLAGVIFASIPGSEPASLLQIVAVNAVSAGIGVLYLLVARGLDRRRHWAVSAIRPLLVLLLAWGSYAFLAALLNGAVRIPVTPVAAGLVLYGARDFRPLPGLNRAGAACVLVMAGLIALELANQPLFGWGGLFDVHEQDLHATLSVDCGPPGAGPPDRLSVVYEWRWSSATLLANDEDQLVFGWNGDDAAGRPLYVLGQVPELVPGMSMGLSDRASASMARAAAAPWRGLVGFRLDLGALDVQPGRIAFELTRRPGPAPEPATLTVGGTYVHVGAWRRDAPSVSCAW